MIKSSIHQKRRHSSLRCTDQITELKICYAILTELKGEIDKSTIILGVYMPHTELIESLD